MHSYTRQSKEVQRLKSRIGELLGELDTLKMVSELAYIEGGVVGQHENDDVVAFTTASYNMAGQTFATMPSHQ